MNYLLELDRNSVKLRIANGYTYNGGNWNIDAEKTANGMTFRVDKYYDSLEDGLIDVYEMWKKFTAAMPEHRLAVIEYQPAQSALDDEF